MLASTFLLGVLIIQGCKNTEKPQSAEPIKVVTQTVSTTTNSSSQDFSGTIEEENGSSLSFSSAGTVHRVYVSEGQLISAGTLIAEVDPASVRNAYNATAATLEQAQDAYNRMKQLHDNGSLSDIKWIEIESKLKQAVSAEKIARKSLIDCKLYAPFGGYVAQKSVEIGQNVIPGMEVIKLVRIDKVKVKLSIPEEEIASIRLGQTATINVVALDGSSFTGKVVEKGVAANPLTRTYEVKILVPNSSHRLLPGMVCDINLNREATQATAISLPATIVQIDIDNHPFVWTMVDGKAHKTLIGVGESVGDNVVVTSGLSNGDKVIVKGQQKVSEGTSISEK